MGDVACLRNYDNEVNPTFPLFGPLHNMCFLAWVLEFSGFVSFFYCLNLGYEKISATKESK